jgi:hemoglobin/transferrin/lactoferrin receptor protein
MKPYLSLAAVLAWTTALPAQTAKTPAGATPLSELIVTATRIEQDVLSVPHTAHVVRREDFIDRRAVRTIADALSELPGVMVQRTSYGQASPFIRGFTGFRTLMLIDGIRLNNAVFREGPNQYWSTIDPLSINHFDVVKGPTSVLHGSDAIGGTINAVTFPASSFLSSRASVFGTSPAAAARVSGSGYYRYASAENSHTARGMVTIEPSERLGFVAGTTIKDFDDLRGGDETGVLPMSGYREKSADFKVAFRPTAALSITAAYQRLRQDDVPRTHATIFGKTFAGTAPGTDLLRNLDQKRDLAYLQFDAREPAAWLSRAHLSFSWHRQAETQERIRSNRRRETGSFRDDQYGVLLNLTSRSPVGHLAYGLDYYRDEVDSNGTDTPFGGATRLLPRGPVADDARYDLLGIYLQDQLRLGERIELTAGLRYTYAGAEAAKVVPEPADNVVFNPLDRSFDAITATVRARLDLSRSWNVFGGASQGFRAPNLSDYTSFELARSGERETPAPNLTDERYVSFELGTKARLPQWRTEFYAAAFYTQIEDQITRYPTGSLINGEREVTKANTGDGNVHGFELGATVDLNDHWSFFGNLTWAHGSVDTYVNNHLLREPASRIQPLTAIFGPRWHSADRRIWAEAVVRVTGRQDRLSPGDVLDTQRIPPGGTPGSSIFNVRAGWRVRPQLNITAGVENVFNEDYRTHGSGINEPGLNVVAAIHATF